MFINTAVIGEYPISFTIEADGGASFTTEMINLKVIGNALNFNNDKKEYSKSKKITANVIKD